MLGFVLRVAPPAEWSAVAPPRSSKYGFNHESAGVCCDPFPTAPWRGAPAPCSIRHLPNARAHGALRGVQLRQQEKGGDRKYSARNDRTPVYRSRIKRISMLSIATQCTVDQRSTLPLWCGRAADQRSALPCWNGGVGEQRWVPPRDRVCDPRYSSCDNGSARKSFTVRSTKLELTSATPAALSSLSSRKLEKCSRSRT